MNWSNRLVEIITRNRGTWHVICFPWSIGAKLRSSLVTRPPLPRIEALKYSSYLFGKSRISYCGSLLTIILWNLSDNFCRQQPAQVTINLPIFLRSIPLSDLSVSAKTPFFFFGQIDIFVLCKLIHLSVLPGNPITLDSLLNLDFVLF